MPNSSCKKSQSKTDTFFTNNFGFLILIFILQLLRRRFGEAGLPEHSINIKMQGSAGQSFCAFMAKGIHVTLEGDANDYVGKVSFLNFLIYK